MTNRIGDVVNRHRRHRFREIVETIEGGPQLPVRNSFVNMPMDDERWPVSKQDGLQGLASEFRPPFLLFAPHRDVRRWIVRQEDAQVVPREQLVQDTDPSAVFLREMGQVLPLPPSRAVEASEAADHPDLLSPDCPSLRLVPQEPHAICPCEAGYIG